MWIIKELSTLTVLSLFFLAMWVWVDYIANSQTIIYGW